MVNQFVFRDRSTEEFDIRISGLKTYTPAVKNLEKVVVPGRNGDLLLSNDRFENVEIKYDCFITKNMKMNFENAKNWLSAEYGYFRLIDTYNPNHYRLAIFERIEDIEVFDNIAVSFTIVFNCKPQRYTYQGELLVSVPKGVKKVFENETMQVARPLIEVVGTGEIKINDSTIKVLKNANKILIDCELEDAHFNGQNLNKDIVVVNGFPKFDQKQNYVEAKGVDLKIKARWWSI